jgi:hypothetical protein
MASGTPPLTTGRAENWRDPRNPSTGRNARQEKTMLNLETICEMLEGSMTDAKVWAESGYIWIEQDGETSRLSIDRVRQ